MTDNVDHIDQGAIDKAQPPEHPHLMPEAARMLDASLAAKFSFIDRDKVIPTATFDFVQDRLAELYAHPQVIRPPGVALAGPSGIGKSMAVDEFMRRRRPRRSPHTGLLLVPVLYLEYPPIPSSRWYASTILKGLGYTGPISVNYSEIFELMLERFELARTRLIICEELNQLEQWPLDTVREWYGVTRWLMNKTKIPQVLVGTEQILDLLDGDVQMVRRFERLELKPWVLGPEFAGFVRAYLGTLPLSEETVLTDQMLQRIHEAGQGITDTVVKVLNRAAKKALVGKKGSILLEHIAPDASLPPPVVTGRKLIRRRRKRTLH